MRNHDSSSIGFHLKWILPAVLICLCPLSCEGAETGSKEPFEIWWLERFCIPGVPWSEDSVCATQPGMPLPAFEVIPTATGEQFVRVSLPFPAGTLPEGFGVVLEGSDGSEIQPDLRILTLHPGLPKFVRRAILSFPFEFGGLEPVRFTLSLLHPKRYRRFQTNPVHLSGDSVTVHLRTNIVRVGPTGVSFSGQGKEWRAELFAPPRTSPRPAKVELVEEGRYYAWVRILAPDPKWPRIIEVQADCLGTVAVRVHLQRVAEDDGYAPDFGWKLEGDPPDSGALGTETREWRFDGGEALTLPFNGGTLAFPTAPLTRRGGVEIQSDQGVMKLVYHRCYQNERVPHQPMAWRRAGFVVTGPGQAIPNRFHEPPHKTRIAPLFFDRLYGSGRPLNLSGYPDLEACLAFHRDAIIRSALRGDDFGNITLFRRDRPPAVFGMNRLNHCPAIFDEFYRSGDERLRTTALDWCDNFHDLTVWWGHTADFGGTRYNNSRAMGRKEHADDDSFMWRSNSSVHFCTKGFDSFFLAYEETGDPRFLIALISQIGYAMEYVHTNQGESRNIGIVADFMRMAEFTGVREFEEKALHLFRELREKLGPDYLFSQSGRPIVSDLPFIDDDRVGSRYPFAKPYILGYALAGLPALGIHFPDERGLREVIVAVARFMASAQDPLGGWRYPHPRSTRLLTGQGMEHSNQLCNAISFLESQASHKAPVAPLLDSIERTLKTRFLVWRKSGKILRNVMGWEKTTGLVTEATVVYDLYAKPEDRDFRRDYAEGKLDLEACSPEGLVYFPRVLACYLSHRPIERLFRPQKELEKVLERIQPVRPRLAFHSGEPHKGPWFSIEKDLPIFRGKRMTELRFPDSFDPEKGESFEEWRKQARSILLESYSTPPPRVPFDAAVIAVEDRGEYEARKIELNISGYERIPAYLLVPEAEGPLPGLVLLHDHGAHFSIGKEKVVRPFGESEERIRDASEWVERLYGGRFIGDELARRGYVCLAIDALFWGDRGRKEGPDYEAQQAFAGNLYQLGLSWAGVIAWDDLRSVEFLRSLPEVDPDRIGAVGLSMGANRCWHLMAGTDRVKVGAAVCWMGTTPGLVVPGNNQTRGQSAYSMLHPGLRNFMDYPDVASIACPKPMLFYNGSEDGLFPVSTVRAAYERMRKVWDSQDASDRLITEIWPVPHVFTVEMQEKAFRFLDRQLRSPKS